MVRDDASLISMAQFQVPILTPPTAFSTHRGRRHSFAWSLLPTFIPLYLRDALDGIAARSLPLLSSGDDVCTRHATRSSSGSGQKPSG
jgi:hypothetical protein